MQESVYLLENTGVFESMRSYNSRIFKLDEHINRLWESCKSTNIELRISKEKLKKNINNRLKVSNLKDAYIRVAARHPALQDTKGAKINIIIKNPKIYPDNFYRDGIKVTTVTTKKNHPNAQNPKIKSSDFLGGILANLENIDKKDITELILLNRNGLVAEGTVSNLFIVKDGLIITGPSYLGILEGITRNCVIDLAKKMNIEVLEIPFTRHQLYNADEAFLTNTSFGIMPVSEVDSRKIGTGKPGELTKKFMERFKELIKETLKW